MNRKIIITILIFGFIAQVLGQRTDINLSFTCDQTNTIYKLDSIKVVNISQGGYTMLYSPDTVLSLDYIDGVLETENNSLRFRILQNYPNPIIDKSTFEIYIPEKGIVSLRITDISGNQTIAKNILLDEGLHSFNFTLASGQMFILTASWNNKTERIKILTIENRSSLHSTLEYIGKKKINLSNKELKYNNDFIYNYGDTLLLIGFSKINNEITGSDIIRDAPLDDNVYIFNITEGIPCIEMQQVYYMGHVYNTVQIHNQCWLKENLNTGLLINGNQVMQDNGVIEKYCINNSEDSCAKYGGLYQWDELVNYSVTNGPQGICPSGWHIPSSDEWKILEGSIDSEYGIGDPEWENIGQRGSDVGNKLKSKDGWLLEGSGDNSYGFSALPAGLHTGSFNSWIGTGLWWTSSYYMDNAFYHALDYSTSQSTRSIQYKHTGLSIRCIKD